MNGWRKACWVLAVLVVVGLAVLVVIRKMGKQPDETDKSSVLAAGPRFKKRRIETSKSRDSSRSAAKHPCLPESFNFSIIISSIFS